MKFFKILTSVAIVLASSFSLAENGITDKEILIGQFAATSGPAGQLGQRLRVGMLAQFNAVNAQGGIDGRKIKLAK